MGVQLIFVVETNKKCGSDWIYIKETIERFYTYERTQLKFTPIYMDGKGKYLKKEADVTSKERQYRAMSKSNQSKVIYCFDCDEYDRKPEDADFLKNARKFCEDRGYKFVWFCKDIENVYIGKRIDDSQKKKEAVNFKSRKLISRVIEKNLSQSNYKIASSNILNILDECSGLIRKN